MGLVQVRVEMSSTTALPEDDFVNTFNYRWSGATAPSEADLGGLADIVEEFYNTAPPSGGRAPAERMSLEVSRDADACRIKVYTKDDLGDLLFGSPSYERTWTLEPAFASAGVVVSLPAECAIVASCYATTIDVPEELPPLVEGGPKRRPAARRRGRLYLGPWTTAACSLGDDAEGVQRVDDSVALELLSGLKRMGEDTKNIMDLNEGLWWGVWSRVDVALRDVIHVHIDNAFDTQRKRGGVATARQSVVIDQT